MSKPENQEEIISNRVWLGLGANLGNRIGTIRRSLEMIGELPDTKVILCSSLYATSPIGPQDQPEYINGAAEIRTSLEPAELLTALKEIEHQLGRKNRDRWREREIDIDILLYGPDEIITGDLQIPHPELHKRSFVLIPLAEIAPEIMHPVLGKRVRELVEGVGI